ncbi:ADP-heptose--lipooligosaccharide heptosyltransferase II [Nitratiruptor sp. YY08-26]|uniref:glycosyltransferase family 9 protein n=1 Tax=unclassified Nitratiruptor TaxID=2624044 RepID=UPI0019160FB2|nr:MULTISPECIES: glycosyltransferase family 9 protein [unclassified Nitratiruptor]BCD62559.1 ADP-heptose--lipooligosaccharide heptosyltransferase II [Nitratiruptor sp. YY08-13]BCD66495.1 ADP-heptose--lipooligosaccharide heptosyltransferase II [Nitratiruptor sp. YY08-26]
MKRVVIFHNGGIGDTIMATPMMQMLYDNGYAIDLLLHSSLNKTIITGLNIFENIYVIDKKSYLLFFVLKNFKKYDYLIGTVGADVKKLQMLALLIGVKEWFGKYNEKNRHRIDENIDAVKELLHKSQVKQSPYVYLQENEKIIEKYIEKNKKNLGFAIGSGKNQKFKRWDIENYKKLFEKYQDENILVFIGPDEIDLKKQLRECKNITVVNESLKDTIAIINHLDLLVGNDNGLMHIGYALKKKTLTLYGMTNRLEIGGYDEKINHYIDLELSCRENGCFDSKIWGIRCVRDSFACLEKITPKMVRDRIDAILKENR